MAEAPDYDTWLSKAEVAERFGKSVTFVVRLQRTGKLKPKLYQGENRYDPKEVEKALVDPEVAENMREQRREEFAEYQLTVVRDLVNLVREPRVTIDALQERIIERQAARIEMLEKRLDGQREELEKARDGSMERQAALEMLRGENNVKSVAMMRIVDTVGKLITGGKVNGVQLTPEQCADLIKASEDGEEPFLTKEQVNEAKKFIASSSNGKSVVDAAKKVVDTVIHDQG